MTADEMITPERASGRIWEAFCRALDAEPREHCVIRGASGLDHPVQALAVDDKNARVLIVSAEPDPRVAAMMQVDIQTNMPGTRVLVARPVIFDLGVLARKAFTSAEAATFDMQTLQKFFKRVERLQQARTRKFFDRQVEALMGAMIEPFRHVTVPALTQIVNVIQQAAYLDWPSIIASAQEKPDNPTISVARLLTIDNLAIDRKHGVCPVPLYEFRDEDWELFGSGTRLDEVRQRLKELDIYQYFFPAPDQLALGVVERGVSSELDIIKAVETAPDLGHPLGSGEIVPSAASIPDVLEQLKAVGYVAEGEHGIEISSTGQTIRSTIKYRPRESFLTKLLGRMSVNVNASVSPKDFIGP